MTWARSQVQLGQDAANVGLRRLHGNYQGVADLGTGQASRDQSQHLGLSLGQRLERRRRRRVHAWPASEVSDQTASHRRSQQRVTVGNYANCLHELRSGCVLQQEPLAPARSASYTYSSRSNVVSIKRPRTGVASRGSEYLAGRMQPVQHRHSHIHQDDVWLELTSLVDRFGSIGGLAHNLKVWLGREYRSETLAHHRLIVDARIRRGSAAAQPVHGTGGRCHRVLGTRHEYATDPRQPVVLADLADRHWSLGNRARCWRVDLLPVSSR